MGEKTRPSAAEVSPLEQTTSWSWTKGFGNGPSSACSWSPSTSFISIAHKQETPPELGRPLQLVSLQGSREPHWPFSSMLQSFEPAPRLAQLQSRNLLHPGLELRTPTPHHHCLCHQTLILYTLEMTLMKEPHIPISKSTTGSPFTAVYLAKGRTVQKYLANASSSLRTWCQDCFHGVRVISILQQNNIVLQFSISYHDDLTGTKHGSGTTRFLLHRAQMDVCINTH